MVHEWHFPIEYKKYLVVLKNTIVKNPTILNIKDHSEFGEIPFQTLLVLLDLGHFELLIHIRIFYTRRLAWCRVATKPSICKKYTTYAAQ